MRKIFLIAVLVSMPIIAVFSIGAWDEVQRQSKLKSDLKDPAALACLTFQVAFHDFAGTVKAVAFANGRVHFATESGRLTCQFILKDGQYRLPYKDFKLDECVDEADRQIALAKTWATSYIHSDKQRSEQKEKARQWVERCHALSEESQKWLVEFMDKVALPLANIYPFYPEFSKLSGR